MGSDVRREFIPYLTANGFKLERTNGKHDVWSDGKVRFPLPTGKVKSTRMYNFLRSELRKKCLAVGKEFIDLRYAQPKEKKVQTQQEAKFTNKPKLREGDHPVVPPAKAEKFKEWDKEALDFCLMAKKEHWTQPKMAEALAQMGYRRPSGEPYTYQDVSVRLCKAGHQRRYYPKRNMAKGKTASARKIQRSFLNDVREIVNSNLPESTQENMLRLYVKSVEL